MFWFRDFRDTSAQHFLQRHVSDFLQGLTKEDILEAVNAHMFQDSSTRSLRYTVTESKLAFDEAVWDI